jgi:uncharacterized damage-inducible protein DinB
MVHPRVDQLRFARSEWLRGLEGLSEVDAGIRLLPMNSISWMVGHMAWHERLCWMRRARGLKGERVLDAFATGHPTSVPSFARVQAAWERVVAEADPFLDGLTTGDLLRPLAHDTREHPPSAGSQLQYVTYHYWSHIGEVSAVRQLLGHTGLAEYVGDFTPGAEYRPDSDRG